MDTSMQPVINAFAHGMWSIVLPIAIIGILIGLFFGIIVFFLRKRLEKNLRNSKRRYRN
jgi:ABC-type amino acid transport system permease subunit